MLFLQSVYILHKKIKQTPDIVIDFTTYMPDRGRAADIEHGAELMFHRR